MAEYSNATDAAHDHESLADGYGLQDEFESEGSIGESDAEEDNQSAVHVENSSKKPDHAVRPQYSSADSVSFFEMTPPALCMFFS